MIRIMSVADHWLGSTGLERTEALERLEACVVRFDQTSFLTRGGWLSKRLHHRLLVGPNVQALNAAVLEKAEQEGPFDIAWFDKANWIWPKTLVALRRHARFLVHNTPDDAFHVNRSRHFHAGIPHYDLCITNKSFDLAEYRARGARRVLLLPQGAGSRFFGGGSAASEEAAGPSISFIGHHEPHYDRILMALARAGLTLEVWGPGWPAARGTDPLLGPMVKGEGVWGPAYVATIQRSLIGLGLLSKRKPDTFTTRSFEIPAAGRLLLAERTREHQLLFEEGVEAAFFDSVEELIEQARALLAHPDRAMSMAAAGHRRVRENYQWHQVLALAFDALGLAVPQESRAARANPLKALAA